MVTLPSLIKSVRSFGSSWWPLLSFTISLTMIGLVEDSENGVTKILWTNLFSSSAFGYSFYSLIFSIKSKQSSMV